MGGGGGVRGGGSNYGKGKGGGAGVPFFDMYQQEVLFMLTPVTFLKYQ